MLSTNKLKKIKSNFPVLVGDNVVSKNICNLLVKEISNSKAFDDMIMGGRSRINKGSKNFNLYIKNSVNSAKLFKLFNSKSFYKKIDKLFTKNFKDGSWINLYKPEIFNPKKFTIKKKLNSSGLKKILGNKTNININKIITYPISFKFNSIFSKNNSPVLGDGSYNVHPVAGQGFNLIIRDIMKLFQFIEYNQSLGLPIRDSEIIKKFVSSRKPENLLFGLGINLTNSFFKQNKIISPIKDFILKDINKFNFLKEMSIKISDKGIFQSLK